MNDYESDIEFGEWIRKHRKRQNLSLLEASIRSGISLDRLRDIEVGYTCRGITRTEAVALSTLYQIESEAIITMASGPGPIESNGIDRVVQKLKWATKYDS